MILVLLFMVVLIMACSLIGSVFLIGLCGSIPADSITTSLIDDPPPIVREEPSQDGWNFNTDQEDDMFSERITEESTRSELREWIANKSVAVLRAQGKTDEEIKSELLRDFGLTEEQVDVMLATR